MNLPSFLNVLRRDSVSGLENPSVDITAALVASVDGTSASGVSVTPLKAFRLAAVYACVRAIAESIASLPIEISKADATREGRELVRDDARWSLLNGFPNPEQTSMELLENWFGHAILHGRGYLYIDRNNKGAVDSLWPLRPDATERKRTVGTNLLYYQTTLANGETRKLPPEAVIELESIFGMSPVMNGRDVIAGGVSAEQYAGRFWANNARPGGIIQLPESMDEDEMEDFMRRWRAGHEGLKRAQLTGILTGGATWKDVGIAPGEAQFIETRNFSVREIARMFRVPPHVIGDLEGTVSRASIEQQAIEFVTYTLRPWIVRAEQTLRFKLFTTGADLAADVFPMFNFDALMRGDIRSRYDAYAVGVQWGFLNRADPRRREGLPTAADTDNLEEFLVPLNMIPSSRLDEIDVAQAHASGSHKGTDSSAGSDGSGGNSTNALSLALLSGMLRDRPDLSDRLADLSERMAGGHDVEDELRELVEEFKNR